MEHRLSSRGLFFPALASGFSWVILLNMTIVSISKPQRPEGCSVCGTRDQQAESPPRKAGQGDGVLLHTRMDKRSGAAGLVHGSRSLRFHGGACRREESNQVFLSFRWSLTLLLAESILRAKICFH
uniref:Uncharacterized protein n=1 Tax=Myotis myotis TaxID=51298 RepID=A0A7J8AMC8_MYOMY|nr:hypothetical protein mMyoMyo1_008148 [Myotis myotis]